MRQASRTLTYLDLKSNNLTDSGVVSLTDALSSKLTFRKLLLEGNHLSLAAVMGARAQIRKSGAPNIDINFGVSLAEPALTLCPTNVPRPKSSSRYTLLYISTYTPFFLWEITFLTSHVSHFENADRLSLMKVLVPFLRFLDR